MARGPGAVRSKSIFDPVHGPVRLPPGPLELVGDPAFQRLWGIRQTGLAHLVFPGANHTRLEHSLGVYWVAGRMAQALGLSTPDARLLEFGGLLHDLGHPPLSHTLDGPMREFMDRSHEAQSRRIVVGDEREGRTGGGRPSRIPEILERNGVDPGEVADLIDPRPSSRRIEALRPLLHGAIDADRIDYLQRDAHYTGVAHGAIDASRLLDTLRRSHREIVFAEKGWPAVEGFVVGRSLMYSSVYFHKTVRAAEIMAQGAVERLPVPPDEVRQVLRATDAELFVLLGRSGGISAELMRGLRERRLYKRVGAWRGVSGARRRTLREIARRPGRRREVEDELVGRIGGRPGEVLLDLSGADDPDPSEGDFGAIGIVEGRSVTHPFRSPGVWREIARRPRTPYIAAIYAAPSRAAVAHRRLGGGPIPFG